MVKYTIISIIILIQCFTILSKAQASFTANHIPSYIIKHGDTIRVKILPTIHVFNRITFYNEYQKQYYARLVRDVRIAYPYAKLVASSIIETYEYMQSIPDKKERQKQLEKVQNYILNRYKPQLKKMTRNQGKILIKLIDRECHTSSYEIVKSLVGSFRAGVFQTFARLFGNSLKERYDPYGKDASIEAIVIQIEDGSIDHYYDINYHGSPYY